MAAPSAQSEVAQRRFRLLLVNPHQRIKQYAINIGMARLLGKRASTSPPALPLIAALTPSHWDVRIYDEELDGELSRLPPGEKPDLVGITAITPNVDRAYELAGLFRGAGIKVVMGGPHVSYNVDEALAHADAVVKGEAEEVWGPLVADFEKGALQQRYTAPGAWAFVKQPMPRWDLVDTDKLSAVPVQASRGCPFGCDFCVARVMFGSKMRYRELDNLLEEIQSLPKKTLLFTDDNLTANKKYARLLMERLEPLGLQWVCMASIDIAKDPELLEAMSRAGCMHVLIGFESLNPQSLTEAHKKQNKIENYAAAIDRIHAAGINVIASFVVGFDHDTLEEFDRIREFMRASNLWYAHLNILDVLHGTDLLERVRKEGRYWGRPHWFSGGLFPVMHYANFSQLEVFDRNFETIERLFSPEDLYPRAMALYGRGTFNRPRVNRDIGLGKKVLLSFKLAWWYLASGDGHKRRLFVDLFGLMRRGVVSAENAVVFLMTTEGVRRQMAHLRQNLDAWRERIRAADKGPWKAQLATRTPPELPRAANE